MIVRKKRTIFFDKGDKIALLTFSVYVIMFLVMRPEAKKDIYPIIIFIVEYLNNVVTTPNI
jgi:hypothetical protein